MKPRWYRLAKKSALSSSHKKYRMGAVLIKGNKVISTGKNNPLKTHPLSTNIWRTVHAELDVILGVSKEDLCGASICVVRINKKGLLRSSLPCVDCQALVKHVGIKNVYYITELNVPDCWEVA